MATTPVQYQGWGIRRQITYCSRYHIVQLLAFHCSLQNVLFIMFSLPYIIFVQNLYWKNIYAFVAGQHWWCPIPIIYKYAQQWCASLKFWASIRRVQVAKFASDRQSCGYLYTYRNLKLQGFKLGRVGSSLAKLPLDGQAILGSSSTHP